MKKIFLFCLGLGLAAPVWSQDVSVTPTPEPVASPTPALAPSLPIPDNVQEFINNEASYHSTYKVVNSQKLEPKISNLLQSLDSKITVKTESLQPGTYNLFETKEVTGFDQVAHKYIIKHTIHGETAQTTEEQSSPEQLQTHKQIADILAACASAGGHREIIEVVGGKFDTCAITSPGGTIWIGDVPLNIVKLQTTDAGNNVYTQEISTFYFIPPTPSRKAPN